MSNIWFQSIKKIKSDDDFIEQQAGLSALLAEGLAADVEDAKGRTALQQLFAKPSPSALATQWLLAMGADPGRVEDVRLRITELYPEAADNASQLQNKQYRAAPYLALLAATETREGAPEDMADSAHYQTVFNQALVSCQRIEALKASFTDLPLSYRACTTTMMHPWQSHWGGKPWLPSATAPSLAPELRLLCQLHFDALPGPHPLPPFGLLQVFVDPAPIDDAVNNERDGDNVVRQRLTALYWPELPASPQGWQPMPQWQLHSEECRADVQGYPEPVAIAWQSRQQLPAGDLGPALATLPAALQPDAKALSDERRSGAFGLLPQLAPVEQNWLPEGHKPLLHLLHQSDGGLLLSLPEQALAGFNTDWQALTLTRYYD
ncbi:YwqG family protein [Gallaecimonas mangrovi]|uniref:DUF1963 domain-containing protein n=1 Tax=Gallaecimonas mangrovi TaxID=2291597 RepID=UPI001867F8BB|nr:DUF1963 domain-containing protein [Gallaecimonas mangrovi]